MHPSSPAGKCRPRQPLSPATPLAASDVSQLTPKGVRALRGGGFECFRLRHHHKHVTSQNCGMVDWKGGNRGERMPQGSLNRGGRPSCGKLSVGQGLSLFWTKISSLHVVRFHNLGQARKLSVGHPSFLLPTCVSDYRSGTKEEQPQPALLGRGLL